VRAQTPQGLNFGALGADAIHLCIDMQRVFAEETPWHTPWMPRVLPIIEEIAGRHAGQTVFTRFIPPARPEDMPGAWQRYYRRWHGMTLNEIDQGLLDLVPSLARLAPPATIVDKHVYSPFVERGLIEHLRARSADTLVITGAETDVCVLAAVLGAMDFGYRVVIASDAICSSADATHDALLMLYQNRFTEQVEIADAETILSHWS
jgi:nicotinamidase-related amidase